MQQEALSAVRVLEKPLESAVQRSGVCLFDESWHQGVVGLVASRVKERLRRPVIAFASADAASLRGSARSIEGVHIREIMQRVHLKPEAKFVMIHADPGYTTNLALSDLVDDDVILALAHDGQPLAPLTVLELK